SATVSADRLERFFARQSGFYRVNRGVRDVVLFASHDLFKDPPFCHIDLIVCRNFLSGLQPEVRQGVLNLFHYALEPDGLLLVGPQDEVNAPALFEMQSGPIRLYRRAGRRHRAPELPASMQPFGPIGVRAVPPEESASRGDRFATLYLSAIEPYAPA